VNTKAPSAPRCAALVGPYLSGKTTLLESILVAAGAVNRKGSIPEGNTVGDAAPEARARQMSVEINVATTDYLGDEWTFIDCPGSVELAQEAVNALTVVDVAVVVCEPDIQKALAVSGLLRVLGEKEIPHIIFINKMDHTESSVKETLEALQDVSDRPLVLREIPIRDGDDITGHVDLVSERAFKWNPDGASELISLPDTVQDRESEARTELLEALADFDDDLLESLLEDVVPEPSDIYDSLAKDLQEAHIVPVFFGSAQHDNGIRRLLKALRHEVPDSSTAAARLGIEADGDAVVQVFKTMNAAQTGKLSIGRVWHGEVKDGMTLDGSRVSGLFRLLGHKQDKRDSAPAGAIVGMGRMDEVSTGQLLSTTATAAAPDWPETLTPLYSLAIHADQRSDEVKLSGALAKLVEEDPSFSFQPNQDTGELLLRGLGEVHLQIAIDRLKNRFNLAVSSSKPRIPYKETIRKSVSQHARHKKQTGGHGQFGDVHVDIKPLPRGSGFVFEDSISGGVVPKQYIPSVENGVKEFMVRGPLGFPVVDISVTLTDGQFHAVDSSDMAFKSAAQLAMREGMPKCDPVLLEPVLHVDIAVPNEFTSRLQRLISGRRGQILGFDAKPGWNGWDAVSVQMPESEAHDLINELRSITLGTGTFDWRFDHLQELTGKPAEQVVADRNSDG
jgi:elongation factor G